MGEKHQKVKVTVEELLRIKRDERPGAEFWESFESDFQRRRLNALVESSTTRGHFWIPGLKAMAIGLPVILLVGAALFWTQFDVLNGPQLAAVEDTPELLNGEFVETAPEIADLPVEPAPEFDTSVVAASQFVVDAIQSSQTRSNNFRKVLYTPAIRLSAPTGASYVRDSMSTKNYRVTTADFKQGRNF